MQEFFIFYNINCIKGLEKWFGENLRRIIVLIRVHCVIGVNISNHACHTAEKWPCCLIGVC